MAGTSDADQRMHLWNERHKEAFLRSWRWWKRTRHVEEDEPEPSFLYTREEGVEAGDSDEEEIEWELTDEWTKRFAESEEKRKRNSARNGSDVSPRGKRETTHRSEFVDPHSRTIGHLQALYGEAGGRSIANLEAELNAHYDAKARSVRAPLWPCEPLRPL